MKRPSIQPSSWTSFLSVFFSSKIKKSLCEIGEKKNETEPRISFPRWKVILDLLLNNLGTFLILFEANLICMILSAYADKVGTRTLIHIHALNLLPHSHTLYRKPDIGTRSITCRHTHTLIITCNTYRLSQSLATRTHTRTERETLTVSLSYLHQGVCTITPWEAHTHTHSQSHSLSLFSLSSSCESFQPLLLSTFSLPWVCMHFNTLFSLSVSLSLSLHLFLLSWFCFSWI